MIHDVLFYLWNHCEKNTDNLFELQEFLHPGDLILLKRIVDTSNLYNEIVRFNNAVLSCTSNLDLSLETAEQRVKNGLYIKAFCRGVHNVLQGYRNEVMDLEKTLLENPQLSLTFIYGSIEKYRKLFEILKDMINDIQRDSLHGCLLMGKLHKYLDCAIDDVSSAADKIIQSINAIFCRHLSNWIVHGDIADAYGEFFICDGKTADANFLYPEQLDSSEKHPRKSRISKPPEIRTFFINWSMVPIYINAELAESILLMGRIVWIVRNEPKKGKIEDKQIKRDIWEGKDMEYYRKVQSLGSKTFDIMEFRSIMEECRLKLTKYLWSVVMDEGDLVEHLQLIRDYYALGRGELFQQFITTAENHLKHSEGEVSQNLNFIFFETARKMYGTNDKSYLRFELNAQPKTESSKLSLWSRLEINFDIKWPLHIVFHPKVMELYKKLFGFLLRLTKTQITLHRLWQKHVVGKQDIDIRVWSLRQNLLFLVHNLHYYLQVDVIEAHFSVLLKEVRNANEFEDIIRLHHEFVSNLLVKTFVSIPDENFQYGNKHALYQVPSVKSDAPSRVYKVIIELLELCDRFCCIASSWDSNLSEPEVFEYEQFQACTDKITECLLTTLQILHKKINSQHLLQLLSQLDFNSYFSKKSTDLNLSAL